MDTLFQNLVNSSTSNNPYATYTPQATATYNAQANNPYASAYQNLANTSGNAFNTTANQGMAGASALNGAGNTALTGANQVLNMGFDPQSALYNQTQQQVMDQSNATNALSGTGNSPYGTSVTNQANTNFNIDWQNQQLQRAIQALSGYTSGTAGANSDFAGANTLGSNAAGNYNNAGAVPFNAANTITGNQTSALNSLLSTIGSGNQNYTQSDLTDIMSYLGLGAGQSDQQASNALQIYADQVAQQNASAGGLGSVLGGLGGLLGGSGGSGGAGGLAALFNTLGASGGASGAGDAAAAAETIAV